MFFFSLALTIVGLLLYSVKNEPETVAEDAEIVDENQLLINENGQITEKEIISDKGDDAGGVALRDGVAIDL